MRQAGLIAIGAVIMSAGQAQALAPGPLVPLEMRSKMNQPSCERLVWTLNYGIERKDTAAILVVGWMHEHGHCVAVNVEKAFAHYTAAYDAGDRRAAERLSALAATPEGGNDIVAALWWARRSDRASDILAAGVDCDPVPGNPAPQEDDFIEAVKRWTQEKVQVCLANVGFRSRVLANMRYPEDARRAGLQGKVQVWFDLRGRTFTVQPEGNRQQPLAQYAEQVLADAMARTRPSPTTLEGRVEFVFEIEQ